MKITYDKRSNRIGWGKIKKESIEKHIKKGDKVDLKALLKCMK